MRANDDCARENNSRNYTIVWGADVSFLLDVLAWREMNFGNILVSIGFEGGDELEQLVEGTRCV